MLFDKRKAIRMNHFLNARGTGRSLCGAVDGIGAAWPVATQCNEMRRIAARRTSKWRNEATAARMSQNGPKCPEVGYLHRAKAALKEARV